MKTIKGNPSYIVRHLMHEVEVQRSANADGNMKAKVKRHDQKILVKEKLRGEGKTCSQSDVAKEMPIYSYKTRHDYASSWKRFFTYVEQNHQIKDVDKIAVTHVKNYLSSLINSDIKIATFKTACASLSKLEVAMNKVRRKPIHFSEQLKTFNTWAKDMLPAEQKSRSYQEPGKIIELLEGKMKIAAELQLYGGARISEITELKIGRNFQGINGDIGIIKLTNTKGGRIREIEVPLETYNRALESANQEGKFQFNSSLYVTELKKAAKGTSQPWNGSHGLRWNFAQSRYREYQDVYNKSPEEALSLVAHDLGHSRPGISRRYLS